MKQKRKEKKKEMPNLNYHNYLSQIIQKEFHCDNKHCARHAQEKYQEIKVIKKG